MIATLGQPPFVPMVIRTCKECSARFGHVAAQPGRPPSYCQRCRADIAATTRVRVSAPLSARVYRRAVVLAVRLLETGRPGLALRMLEQVLPVRQPGANR